MGLARTRLQVAFPLLMRFGWRGACLPDDEVAFSTEIRCIRRYRPDAGRESTPLDLVSGAGVEVSASSRTRPVVVCVVPFARPHSCRREIRTKRSQPSP